MKSKIVLAAALAVTAVGAALVDRHFRSDYAFAQPTSSSLERRVKALEDRIDKINSAPARFKLVNDKTSQCLKWIDNNQPPFMLSCDHDYQVWRMEKVN